MSAQTHSHTDICMHRQNTKIVLDILSFLISWKFLHRRALARVHIFPAEVAARVWCIAFSSKHPIGSKEAAALAEALAIYFSLTVAANDNFLTSKALKTLKPIVKDEVLLKAVCEVCVVL